MKTPQKTFKQLIDEVINDAKNHSKENLEKNPIDRSANIIDAWSMKSNDHIIPQPTREQKSL